jgi:hypothetical protein
MARIKIMDLSDKKIGSFQKVRGGGYLILPAEGRIIFSDGTAGERPPSGSTSITAAYSGGGTAGDVTSIPAIWVRGITKD